MAGVKFSACPATDLDYIPDQSVDKIENNLKGILISKDDDLGTQIFSPQFPYDQKNLYYITNASCAPQCKLSISDWIKFPEERKSKRYYRVSRNCDLTIAIIPKDQLDKNPQTPLQSLIEKHLYQKHFTTLFYHQYYPESQRDW
ncbi:MAG: hypothetical protein RL095_2240 [Verrucomicrobiota bacterium]